MAGERKHLRSDSFGFRYTLLPCHLGERERCYSHFLQFCVCLQVCTLLKKLWEVWYSCVHSHSCYSSLKVKTKWNEKKQANDLIQAQFGREREFLRFIHWTKCIKSFHPLCVFYIRNSGLVYHLLSRRLWANRGLGKWWLNATIYPFVL